MAEPAGDCTHIDAGGYQLGCRVVAQLVDGRLDSEPARKARVTLTHSAGLEVIRAVDGRREHERVRREVDPESGGAAHA